MIAKNVSSGVFVLCLMTSVLSCKKDSTNPIVPGGGGAGGATVSDTLKNAILDSVLAFASTLPHIDPEADNQSVLQFLHSRHEIQNAGIVQPGSVWGQFSDGKVFIYINNLFPGNSAAPYMFPLARGSPGRGINNLPSNTRVRLLNALGSPFEPAASNTIQSLRSWFNSIGYTEPLGAPDASVDALKQVQGDGVFYMSSHGGFAGATDVEYAVWTTDEVNLSNDTRFKLDLDSGYVIKLCCDIEHSAHYGITSKFVQRYMGFAPTSLVLFNACNSDEAGFKAACQAKNATVYAGWDKPINEFYMFDVVQYFFDRLLGVNQYQPEDPPQRPFYYSLVTEDMHLQNRDISNSPHYGTSHFLCTPAFMVNSGTSLKLAPSILQVTPIASPGTTMDIDGLFGSDQGTVVLGSTSLGIISWAPTKIRCTAPENGGNLTVKVRGIKSNTTQLTQWHGQFDYTFTSRGSLQHHAVFDLTFWADVHSWRLLPHHQTYFFDPRLAHLCTSSTCAFESSGEYRDQNGNLVESWAGNGFAPVLQTGNEPAYYAFVGIIDSSGANSTIVLSFRGTYTTNGMQNSFTVQGNLGTLSPRMNSSYVIPGNTLSWSSGTDHATMMWSDLQPDYPPNMNGPR